MGCVRDIVALWRTIRPSDECSNERDIFWSDDRGDTPGHFGGYGLHTRRIASVLPWGSTYQEEVDVEGLRISGRLHCRSYSTLD